MEDTTNSEKSLEELNKRREQILKGAEERFLNGENTDDEGWRSEALAVVADIKQFVKRIDISDQLPCDENGIYLNLQTKEGDSMTVELSCAGFRVCAHQFDTLTNEKQRIVTSASSSSNDTISFETYYETPYALLDSISPAYRDSFSSELAQRLQQLCN
ncbi:hypothetical protein RDWZM_000536 [Blomia tropicalis]|uniref:GSKIP domain-containing protein n=1 Tax=Blomia tropicalis TaxID=40697 RepID=A0A9Q0RPQ8_BLOTA|nr:hypothetical protein RDWZM_000536 [Blomia tropicalis]